jgi:pimeloyl-ACP methyl ester carboxylesterase
MTELKYAKQGSVSFRGHPVWYGIVGHSTARPPVIVVHGGPGLPHDYLEPISALTSTGRRVVFYDQLGCGNSDRPEGAALWSVDLFVEELATLEAALGFEGFHLLGHSWGGALAMEYVLRHAHGVFSLTLADTFPSIRGLLAEWARLRAEMPAPVQDVLTRHERAGTTGEPESSRPAAGLSPACVRQSRRPGIQRHVGSELVGGDRQAQGLGHHSEAPGDQRAHPILAGRHDQCPPVLAELLNRAIPASRLVVFEGSAHLPYIEEPDLFQRVLAEFLGEVETRAATSPS